MPGRHRLDRPPMSVSGGGPEIPSTCSWPWRPRKAPTSWSWDVVEWAAPSARWARPARRSWPPPRCRWSCCPPLPEPVAGGVRPFGPPARAVRTYGGAPRPVTVQGGARSSIGWTGTRMATMDVLDDAGVGGDQAGPGGPAPTGSPPPARRSPERDDRGVGLALLVGFVALVGLFLAVAAIVVAFNRPKEAAAGNSAATVDGAIRLSEFAIEGDLTLPPGHVQLTISNTGSQVHNLEVLGVGKTTDIQPGQSTSLHLGQLAAGKYQLRCNIVGHADSGMTGVLKIDESAAVPAAAGASAAGATHEMSWAEMDKLMLDSIAKFPAATEGHG